MPMQAGLKPGLRRCTQPGIGYETEANGEMREIFIVSGFNDPKRSRWPRGTGNRPHSREDLCVE